MRLIIIPDDNTISVNGNSKAGFDLSELIAAGVHAVQWYGTKGEVEMRVTPDGDKPANVGISDIAQYQKFIDMHTSQPVPAPIDQADLGNVQKQIKALGLVTAQWNGKTEAQLKTAFRAAMASLS